MSKLHTIPGNMYFDVENVCTKDNALITVKLAIFYKFSDADPVQDDNYPMADFINAVSADVREWCTQRTFDDFLASKDILNTIDPYDQLRASAAKNGYLIQKVVFRGYFAPGSQKKARTIAVKRKSIEATCEVKRLKPKMEFERLEGIKCPSKDGKTVLLQARTW